MRRARHAHLAHRNKTTLHLGQRQCRTMVVVLCALTYVTTPTIASAQCGSSTGYPDESGAYYCYDYPDGVRCQKFADLDGGKCIIRCGPSPDGNSSICTLNACGITNGGDFPNAPVGAGPSGGSDYENPTIFDIEQQPAPDPEIDPAGRFIDRRLDVSTRSAGSNFVILRRLDSDSDYNGAFGDKVDSSLFARVDVNASRALVYVNGDEPVKFKTSGSDFISSRGRTLTKVASDYIYALPNGVTYWFDDNNGGRAISKRQLNGNGFKWAYDAMNNLTAIQDKNDNNVLTFLYYDDALITKATDVPGGRSVVYEYDTSAGVLTRATGTCGSCSAVPEHTYVYDDNHNVVTVRNSGGSDVLELIYDGQGRVTKRIKDSGVELTADYDQYANHLTYATVDYVGITRHYYENNQYGLTKAEIKGSIRGTAVTYTYQWQRDEHNVITRSQSPEDRVVHYDVDGNGRILREILYDASNPITLSSVEYGTYNVITRTVDAGGIETHYIHDGIGNVLTKIVDPTGLNLTTSIVYDADGNMLTRTADDGQVTAFEYNDNGTVTKSTDLTGTPVTASYEVDGLGRVTLRIDMRGQTWKTFYASSGKITKSVQATGQTTLYTYDDDQRLITQTVQDAEIGPNIVRTTTYLYDKFGNLTRRTDPGPGSGRHTDYAYDNNDRLTYTKTPTGEQTGAAYDELNLVYLNLAHDGSDWITKTTFYYDGDQNLTRQTDANGSAVVENRQFDQYNRLTRQTDALGHYVVYEHDTDGQVTRQVRYDATPDPDIEVAESRTLYDDHGRVTSSRQLLNPGGSTSDGDALVETVYDDHGRVLTRTVYLAGTTTKAQTTFVYDAKGRVITQTQDDGPTVATVYDDYGSVLSRIVDPAGLALATTYAYDELGRTTRTTQPDGVYSVPLFDSLGRTTKTQQHASGGAKFAASEMLYDNLLNTVTKTYRYADPANQSAFDDDTDPATASLYHANGRLTATVDPNGNTTSFTYDAMGRNITTTDAAGNHAVTIYDNADRVLTRVRIDENGANDVELHTAFEYDVLNRVTKTIDQGPDGDITQTADNLVVTTWFDALGRVTQTQDPSGVQTATAYDGLGRVTRLTEDSGGGGIARFTDSSYDRTGRLTRLTGYTDGTSGAQNTDYGYNKAGKVTRTIYPDDSGGDRGYVVFAYDTVQRLTRINHQDDTNTDIVYDDMGRRLTITKGDEIDSFTYEPWGGVASANRGTSDNLDAVSAVTRSYDGLNRLTREAQSIREGTRRNVDYAYDLAGNALTLTYPSGVAIQTSYDALNRANVLKRNTTQFVTYAYVGPRVDTLTYETGADDVALTNLYDGAGRLTRMTYAQTGNSDLPDFSYAFDQASNITRKTFEHRSGEAEDYAYDTLYRLTRTTFGQRTDDPYEGFIYDHLGNHLTQDDNGTEIAGLFNSVNEQTKRGGTQVYYDKRGNLTKDDDGQVYFYDRQNVLTRVEKPANTLVASYAYDALNRRIEKDVDGTGVTRFYWTADWRLLEETDDAGTPTVQRYYVWGPTYIDELLLYHNTSGGGNDYFACRHHNFNVVAALDTSGGVVERYDYNPYGERFVLDADYSDDDDGVSDVGLNIGHQGLYHDAESGLVYNRARMLHTGLGRFVQRDPWGYADGVNSYAMYHAMFGGVDPFGTVVIFVHGINTHNEDDSKEVYQGLVDAWASRGQDKQAFIHFKYGSPPGVMDAVLGLTSPVNAKAGEKLADLINHLREQIQNGCVDDEPIHVVAYSNGANVAFIAGNHYGAKWDTLLFVGGSLNAKYSMDQIANNVNRVISYYSLDDWATSIHYDLSAIGLGQIDINGIGSREANWPALSRRFGQIAHSTNEASKRHGLTIPASSRTRVNGWSTWLTYYMANSFYVDELPGSSYNDLSRNGVLPDGRRLNQSWILNHSGVLGNSNDDYIIQLPDW